MNRNVLWATGVGIIPFPLVDLAGVTAVQVKMLRELSMLYGIKFFQHTAKNLIGSLVAGVGSVSLGKIVILSLAKVLPVVGPTAGAVAIPMTSAALTYATGKVFIQHFESGGTFLDFDPVKVRDHFRQEVERAPKSGTAS